MKENELRNLLTDLISLPKENEYVEFKTNNYKPESIGEYLSALSNSANLVKEKFGYLVFGIEDETHKVVGTNFKASQTKIGNTELEVWLSLRLTPSISFNIYEFQYLDQNITLFRVPATRDQPVLFNSTAYIRIGSILKPLKNYPEKERKLWQNPSSEFELEIAKENIVAADVIALLDTQTIFDIFLKIPESVT